MAVKDKLNQYALYFLGTIMILGGIGGAATTDIWTDEDVDNTITQANTSKGICLGATCYAGWQVSIETNASIANSQICTPANELCKEAPVGGNGTPGGEEGNIQYNDGGEFNGTNNLNWTGDTLEISGFLTIDDEFEYDGSSFYFRGGGADDQTSSTFWYGNDTATARRAVQVASTGSNPYIRLIAGGTSFWFYDQYWRIGSGSNGAKIRDEAPTRINPIYVAHQNDDTGMGFSGNGVDIYEINFIIGATERLRIGNAANGTTESFNGMDIQNDDSTVVTLKLTADSGQSANMMEVTNASANTTLTIDTQGILNFENGGKIYDNSSCVIIESPGGTLYTFCD